MDATTRRPPFSWPKLGRTLLGLILAPLVGGVVSVVLITIPTLVFDPTELAEAGGLILFGAYFGGLLGLAPALLLGLPVHLLLLKQGWTSIWAYIGIGALLGMGGFFLSVAVLGAL